MTAAAAGAAASVLDDEARSCGWPVECRKHLDDVSHNPPPGTRRTWTAHDLRCPIPNSRPSSKRRNGYPTCSLIAVHAGDCDYDRHAWPERGAAG